MQAALAWMMASRWRAAFIVFLLATLPFTGTVAAAVVALVVLVHGFRDGLVVAAFAAGVLLALHLAVGAAPMQAAALLVAGWLPAMLLAAVLRASRSQARVLGLAGLLGCGVVAGVFAATGDPAPMWETLMRERMLPLFEQAGLRFDSDQMSAALPAMAALMTGVAAAFWALGHFIAVALGRWAQAVLYNPGGFRREFHALRLGRIAAVASGIVFVAGILVDQPLLSNIAVVVVLMWALQGLAVMHGVVGGAALHWGWLVPPYLLALALPPHMIALMAVMGFADRWVDFRTRFGKAE